MIVKAILAAKGSDVISIEPTATLEAAVRTLAQHRIGALLVLGPDRRLIGILSERDIVRVLAEQGADVAAGYSRDREAAGACASEKMLLVRRLIVGVAGRKHHALYPELHHFVKEGAHTVGIGAIKQRRIRRHAEPARQGTSTRAKARVGKREERDDEPGDGGGMGRGVDRGLADYGREWGSG